MSTDFFWAVQEKIASILITCLLDELGNEVQDRQGLGDLYTQFYRMLYTEQLITPANQATMDSILDIVAPCLSLDAYHKLNEPISLLELGNAAKELARGYSSGPDGQAIDFYVKLWPVIGSDFHSMILDAIRLGKLPKGMNRGLIALLHKGGPTNLLTNYSPITLLNVSYKILAKALQKRLQPVLLDLIDED